MHSSAPEIRESIESYLRLLEAPRGSDDDDLDCLADALDRLVYLGRHAPDVGDDDDQPDPPGTDYDHHREVACRRFPSLGYYNVPGEISRSIGNSEFHVGDGIDDLADIARDLTEVLWCFENTTDLDALWHFRFGFEFHWGTHAANLRWYVWAVRRDF